MRTVCPSCGTPVPRSALLLSSPFEPYTCAACKNKFSWSRKRYAFNIVLGVLAALPILLIFYFKMHFTGWQIVLFYVVFLVVGSIISFNLPGQLKPHTE